MVPVGVMRPMRLPEGDASVNQRLPSGPSAIAVGPLPELGSGNSLKLLPEGATRPILLATGSVNHKLPSGPRAMPDVSSPLGAPNSVYVPLGVMRPIPCCLVYQTLPSGPAVMPTGPVLVVDVSKRPNVLPLGVTFPIALGAVLWCVNQMLPSGPAVIAPGSLAVGIGNSVNVRFGPMPATPGLVPLEAPELVELPEAAPLPACPPEPANDVPLEPPVPPMALAPAAEDPLPFPAPDGEPPVTAEPELVLATSPAEPPAAMPELGASPDEPAPMAGPAADPPLHAAAQSARTTDGPTKTRAFISVRGANALVRSPLSAENLRRAAIRGEWVIASTVVPTHEGRGPA